MNRLLNITMLLVLIFNVSCSKDESEDVIPEQITIESTDFNISISENPESNAILGQIQATTNIGNLTYSLINQNPNGALSINSNNGELTVLDETLFDFEINPIITGIVKLTNSDVSEESSITISLSDVEEGIYDGNVTLQNQEEINLFAANNYHTITGFLKIETSSSIINLSELSSLISINGNLNIFNNSELNSLEGLNNLKSVNDIVVFGNHKLNNLEGLNNIELVNSININNNDKLQNINSLSKISVLNDFLNISDNALLSNLEGLNNITSINGSVRIENNSSLTSLLGLNNLSTINNTLYIDKNQSLVSLNGLNKLSLIEISLIIIDNDNLIDINALSELTTIKNKIIINLNEKLINLDGLSNLTSITNESSFQAILNNSLVNFCGIKPYLEANLTGDYIVSNNLFNPTKENILDGQCSQ